MKKIYLLLASENWEDAKGSYEKLADWDFKTNKIFTGYFIFMKEVKTRFGLKTLAKVYNATSKTAYNVWCNTVLAKDIANVPPLAMIKIEYLGKADNQTKTAKYDNYKTLFDKTALLKLADHPEIGETEAKTFQSNSNAGNYTQDNQASPAQKEQQSQQQEQRPASNIDDDLPF